MAWALVAGAAISAAPAIYKGITGIGQSNKANAMKPVNPGYQVNQGVINNAKTLSDQYGNYKLPGYSQMYDNITRNYGDAFTKGLNGASSSGDVLDLATRMAYGKNNAFNQLGAENANGKQGMLGSYLDANAAAGREYQGANEYDRDQYDRQLREKAALTQAGATNTYGALDQVAGAASKYVMAGAGGDKPDQATADAATASQRSVYNKYYYPNGTPRFDSMGNPVSPEMWQGTPGSNAAYTKN